MLTLFPKIKPFAEHRIDVSDGHALYVEESGIPDGIPVIITHGGPGLGSQPLYRRYFDPEVFRIILFDQRGCGSSTPHLDLENNHTAVLIEDIESIRKQLDLKDVILFGGGWGATLALLYAQAYPKNTQGLLLSSPFLARQKDIDWIFKHGANQFFPDAWYDFTEGFSKKEQENILDAYSKCLHGENELIRMAAAKTMATWLAKVATLHPNHEVYSHYVDPHVAACLSIISCHYFLHGCYLSENQILNNIDKIKTIPTTLVHGRFDILHPLESSYLLHQALPLSELNVVRDAGHCASEPGMIDVLIRSGKKFARGIDTY